MPSLRWWTTAALAGLLVSKCAAQDDVGLANGLTDINTANFHAKIINDAQVLASLTSAQGTFDFLPSDYLQYRTANGQYHWGDVTFRYRDTSGDDWINGDTSMARKLVSKLDLADGVLAAADLSPSLPQGPLKIVREWIDEEGDLALRFTIQNTGDSDLEIGSLGFPAEFNSIFTNRSAIDMQRVCSLSDPYIGMDAGHIRVTPVAGTGNALVVTSLNGTSTPLEAYRNLQEPRFDTTQYNSQTFEGFYEWQVFSKAWAEKEWANVQPWNAPNSVTLKAGDSMQFGVRFTLADDVRQFDAAIQSTGTPTASAVPGYILPRDLPALLFLQHSSPVASTSVEPENALQIEAGDAAGTYTVTPAENAWGRVRLAVKYADGKVQTIHWFITKPNTEVLSDLRHFMTTEAYFNDTSDPFGRAPSAINYDSELQAMHLQDDRTYDAGLSDEAGSGAYVSAMAKQAIQPNVGEVAKLDAFIDGVMWKTIQLEDYSVRKSIFYYDPAAMPDFQYDPNINWAYSWTKNDSYRIDRAYNYVHVSVAYWSLYRVARAHPDITAHTWDWYLLQAQKTVMRVTENDIGYRDVGLMGETVWGELLNDLRREGLGSEGDELESAMKTRAELWNS